MKLTEEQVETINLMLSSVEPNTEMVTLQIEIGQTLPKHNYRYKCTSTNIWIDFDEGYVWAYSKEEAIKEAKIKIKTHLKICNRLLKGKYTLEVDLGHIEVERV